MISAANLIATTQALDSSTDYLVRVREMLLQMAEGNAVDPQERRRVIRAINWSRKRFNTALAVVRKRRRACLERHERPNTIDEHRFHSYMEATADGRIYDAIGGLNQQLLTLDIMMAACIEIGDINSASPDECSEAQAEQSRINRERRSIQAQIENLRQQFYVWQNFSIEL